MQAPMVPTHSAHDSIMTGSLLTERQQKDINLHCMVANWVCYPATYLEFWFI